MAINKVFYLAWCGYEASHYASFLESFYEQVGHDAFELTIVCKGPASHFASEEVKSALEIAKGAATVIVPDEGQDIDVYRKLLPGLQPNDLVLFFNTRTRLRNKKALKWLFRAAAHPSRPLVGCCGSYERLNMSDAYPNPHLRTNGFGGEAALLQSLDWTYTERPHEVECGPNSLTRQVIAAGHPCLVVNAQGKQHVLSEWPLASTWRIHGQRKLLIQDNRSDDFEGSGEERRRYLRSLAWYPKDSSLVVGKKQNSKSAKVRGIIQKMQSLKSSFRRRFSLRRRFGTLHFEGFGFEAADEIIETQIGAPVAWERDSFVQQRRDEALQDSSSYRQWAGKVGGHKWLHYFEVYDRDVLRDLPARPRILEIGVYNGASARMWKDLTTDLECYVGIDIDPRCAEYADNDANIFIYIGSQDDPDLLQRVVDEHGPFDLIIDDGSHESHHMIASFKHLFLHGLAPGGQYVVEDTHTMAWRAFNKGRPTFLEFAKRSTDYLNHHYYRRKFNFFRPDGRKVSNSPALTVWLHSVRFFDSIVIFKKRQRDDGPPQVVHK